MDDATTSLDPLDSASASADMSDDLVCDECQWKPRGVKENLRGYLRKHKNVHKNIKHVCEVDGCKKSFSRLDNLKAHKKDKHGFASANEEHVSGSKSDLDSVSTAATLLEAVSAPCGAVSGPISVEEIKVEDGDEEDAEPRQSEDHTYHGWMMPQRAMLWNMQL